MKTTIKRTDWSEFKKLALILGLATIILVAACSCTKQTNTINNTNSNTVVDIRGTWRDPANTLDYFSIKDTTAHTNGQARYYITHYMYDSNASNDFIIKSAVISLPGSYSPWFDSGNTYDCYLYFNGTNMEITIKVFNTNTIYKHIIYQKI